MAKKSSSKVFASLEDINQSIEKNLKNLTDRAKELGTDAGGPVKEYVQELQEVIKSTIELNRRTLEKSTEVNKEYAAKVRTAVEDAFKQSKDEVDRTTADMKTLLEQLLDSLKTQTDKQSQAWKSSIETGKSRLEDSVSELKAAAEDVSKVLAGKKPATKKSAARKAPAKKAAARKTPAKKAAAKKPAAKAAPAKKAPAASDAPASPSTPPSTES